jgi:S1-C subfamily serine protease
MKALSTCRAALGLALGWVVVSAVAGEAATEAELQSAVFRAKPAVVMIGVRVGASATVDCGGGAPIAVRPRPAGWLGSGAIIHSDGWIVTNGHVVQPYYETDDAALTRELGEKAVGEACAASLERLSDADRARSVRALAAAPANRAGLKLEKALHVSLSNGKTYPAVVRTYSPPAYVRVGEKEHGRDVAIIKIDARDLPVVRLARHSTNLNLGQTLFVIGFPGVVAAHELLSRASRYEPSVTVGRVSGFKEDVGGQRVIQTDAAIIQGNSGGPVFDDRGEVVGAATFTSTQGEQVVQGFNFLIPVETIREAAAKAGVMPDGRSEFSRLWNRGVDLYLRDLHYRAFSHMSAAAAIHPGFPDVERVREDCQIKHTEQGYLHREEVQWGLLLVGLIGGVAALWFGGRRLARARRDSLRALIRDELQNSGLLPR